MEEDARARALSHLGAASGMDRDTWNIVNNAILGTTGQYSDNEARLAEFRNQAANNMYGPLVDQPGIWESMLSGLIGMQEVKQSELVLPGSPEEGRSCHFLTGLTPAT